MRFLESRMGFGTIRSVMFAPSCQLVDVTRFGEVGIFSTKSAPWTRLSVCGPESGAFYRLGPNDLRDVIAQRNKGSLASHVVSAGPRQVDVDHFAYPARMGRHDDCLVRQ